MSAVIFDMDGTLINSQRITVPWWELAGQKQGIPGLGEHIPNVCGMNVPGWTGYLREHFPTLNMDAFLADMLLLREHFPAPLALMQGAEALLEHLTQRGIPMAIASGSSRKKVEENMRGLGLLERFSALVGGNEVEQGKPAPDIFLLAAAKMGVQPGECYVVEDSSLGIRAALAAGMKPIFVPDLVPLDEDLKNAGVPTVAHLDDIIGLIG